jgi:hypothetical protein
MVASTPFCRWCGLFRVRIIRVRAPAPRRRSRIREREPPPDETTPVDGTWMPGTAIGLAEALRRSPDHVQMIGQNHSSSNPERTPSSYPAKRRPQYINTLSQESQPALRQIDRKETAACGQEIATIVRHRGRASDGFRFAQHILHLLTLSMPVMPSYRPCCSF